MALPPRPSSANGKIVFTGLDNEEAPTLGGIYLAPLASQPTLTTLVAIGSSVPDNNGNALGDGSTFNALGEALSFDGRFVSFLTASFLSPELESWAGVYLTFVPTFTVLPLANP